MDSKNCYSLKRKNKYSNRVVRIIKNAENSEDSELDASDDEPDKVLAPDFYCDDIANKFIENEWLSETDLEDNESISDFENNEHFEDKENILPASDNVPQPERFEKKLAPNQKRNEQIISWKSGGEVNYPIPTWKGCMPPPCIDEPGTPLFYFKQMISENLLNNIVDQSNLYAIQKNVNKPLGLTLSELEKFIGITMLMSIYKLPRTHMFWKMET
uniref:DDE_Tnp_1_7 domain-containing protein n=1 Tax=Strongyloides stercoralis TaxID=6248 RepID=A0A0K0EC23_STRER